MSQAVVIATGVSAGGRREVLGCAVGDIAAGASRPFQRALRDRGLAEMQLVISDSQRGLANAVCCKQHLANLPGAPQLPLRREGQRRCGS